jgi:formiminotetrahydrofolate cyclodeaminase
VVNVNVNLKSIKDEAFVAAWSQKRDDVQRTGTTALEAALAACAQTLGVDL